MKRSFVLLALALAMTATACQRNQVVVEAALTEAEAARALADLPIRLVPYDRDAIFDSLGAAFPEPEPAIPADLLAQRQEIIQAETEWRTSEDRWSEARDSLQVLSRELDRMGQQGLRATPQYQQLFRQFERLETDAQQAQQRSQSAFSRYDQLQRTFLTQADSIRVVASSGRTARTRTTTASSPHACDSSIAKSMQIPRTPPAPRTSAACRRVAGGPMPGTRSRSTNSTGTSPSKFQATASASC